MEENLYLVYGEIVDYDEHQVLNVIVLETEEEAKKIIEELSKRIETILSNLKRFNVDIINYLPEHTIHEFVLNNTICKSDNDGTYYVSDTLDIDDCYDLQRICFLYERVKYKKFTKGNKRLDAF